MAQYIIPAAAAVIVAIIEAIAAHDRKQAKLSKNQEAEREQRRAKESLLSMRMMSATLQLSVVTANALTGGHNNGNVEAARIAAENAQAEYEEFLRTIASQEVAK